MLNLNDSFNGKVGSDGSTTQHSLEELLSVDLVGGRRIIFELSLPPWGDNVAFRTIKVSRERL